MSFSLDEEQDGKIVSVVSKAQTVEDREKGNFYVYLKVLFRDHSCILKYNLLKENEYTSIDCSTEAVVVFDHDNDAYIFDKNSLTSVN